MTVPAQYGAAPIGVAAAYAGGANGGERMMLLSPGDSDLATITASAQVASLPVANLQAMQPQKKWRAMATSVQFSISCAAPLGANALALVAHNLSGMATIRVRGAATLALAASGPSIDTGAQWAWPSTGKPVAPSWPNWISLVRWAGMAACQCWLVDILDPDPSQTYIEAGRLVLGAAWQPSVNFDLGGKVLAFEPLDVQARTSSGYTFTDRRACSPGRRVALSVAAGNAREIQDGLAELQRLRGAWGDVICFLDPAATTDFHRLSMQALFVGAPDYAAVPYWDTDGGRLSAGITLTEIL